MKLLTTSSAFGRLACAIFILALVSQSCGLRAAAAPANQNDADLDNNVGDGDAMRTVRKMLGGLLTVGQEAINRMGTSSGASSGSGSGMSSSVPVFYDMTKNDTSLGINVLSGLVKVDRVREPDRPRALSVRVFGVPVFSRGFRRGDPMPTDKESKSPGPDLDAGAPVNRPDGGPSDEDEELPLDP